MRIVCPDIVDRNDLTRGWGAPVVRREHMQNVFKNCSPHSWAFFFLQRDEDFCPHRKPHINGYRSSTHNSPHLEATPVSFSKWMHKLVHPHHGLLLSDTTDRTSDTHDNLEESPENYAERKKKPILNGYILCDSRCTTFLEWQMFHLTDWWLLGRSGGNRQQDGCCYGNAESWSMSILWMWYCTPVLHDVTTGEHS